LSSFFLHKPTLSQNLILWGFYHCPWLHSEKAINGKIATAFTALGDPLSALEEIAPERLMALRGRRAEVQIIHRISKGKVYANVSSINGQVIA
jgi:hypothetical protein